MSVRIITDSASDFLEAAKRNVTIIPMTITFGAQEFIDGVTLTHEAFYEKLEETGVIPTTSQISPYEFEAVFREVVESGDAAVVIAMSGKLSGTYQSAVMAREGFKDNIFVVGSENVSLGQHILVDYAIRLRDSGMSAAGIAVELEKKKKDVCLIALLDTLEYLQKGGRLSKTAAIAGGILSIKPVIAIENGEVVVLGKARGSKKGNNMLIEMIEKKDGIDFDMPYMLGYTGFSDKLLKLYIDDSDFLWKDHFETLSYGSIGGTIGTHVGPGAIGVAFFHN